MSLEIVSQPTNFSELSLTQVRIDHTPIIVFATELGDIVYPREFAIQNGFYGVIASNNDGSTRVFIRTNLTVEHLNPAGFGSDMSRFVDAVLEPATVEA